MRSVVKACAPAVLLAVPAIAWVAAANWRASWATLGRDQGIFQYIAWALGEGDVLYRDVRDVNGPVVPMVHALFLHLGGEEEHRFRVLDLVFTGASFALAGASLPSLTPSEDEDGPLVRAGRRAAWALAAWTLLSSQYVAYGFWETAQRESFLDCFVALSVGLSVTRLMVADMRSRRTVAVVALSGALSFVPWLGKPTYALFTLAQIAALVAEREPWRARGRRVATFVGGGALGLAAPLSFLFAKGDASRWARITFHDVPAMYRFIWPRPPTAIFSMPGYATLTALAVTTSAGLALLVAWRRLPARALSIALLPVLGLASVAAQGKGFPYHFHPVSFGMTLGWLAALSVTWHRASEAGRPPALRLAVLAVAIVLGARASLAARDAPYPDVPAARDPQSLESAARLAPYERVDFFPRALRDAAAFVAAHTAPGDRVQTYGMDPYVLFLARRRSATPYVYAYDLDVDAALQGSFEEGGPRPTEEERQRIRAMRDEHERDLRARLEAEPPAAFVFVGRSPLMVYQDAVTDFATHCPETAFWLADRYEERADFDGVRVWLRKAPAPP